MKHMHIVKPTGVKLPPMLKGRLQKIAELQNRSLHWLMKMAIERYVEQIEQEEALKQETMRRWQEVEQGRVVSNQDVVSWLATWGTDHEKRRPICK